VHIWCCSMEEDGCVWLSLWTIVSPTSFSHSFHTSYHFFSVLLIDAWFVMLFSHMIVHVWQAYSMWDKCIQQHMTIIDVSHNMKSNTSITSQCKNVAKTNYYPQGFIFLTFNIEYACHTCTIMWENNITNQASYLVTTGYLKLNNVQEIVICQIKIVWHAGSSFETQ
jgi:hypothetical protein